jgi:hypothetical protein
MFIGFDYRMVRQPSDRNPFQHGHLLIAQQQTVEPVKTEMVVIALAWLVRVVAVED